MEVHVFLKSVIFVILVFKHCLEASLMPLEASLTVPDLSMGASKPSDQSGINQGPLGTLLGLSGMRQPASTAVTYRTSCVHHRKR